MRPLRLWLAGACLSALSAWAAAATCLSGFGEPPEPGRLALPLAALACCAAGAAAAALGRR